MKPLDWSPASLAVLLPAMSELRGSEASRILLCSVDDKALEEAARAYLEAAASSGLAPSHRFAPKLGYGLRGQGNILLSLLRGRRGARRAALVLAEGGESPWPHEIDDRGQVELSDARQIAREIFLAPRGARAEYSREILMRQAVAGLPDLPDPQLRADFVAECLAAYAHATERACAESSGVRGPADEDGLRAARSMSLHGPALARSAPGALRPGVEAAVASARALMEAKARRPDAAADPRAIKAALAPRMEARLRALRSLFEAAPEDGDGARALIAASDFLREAPLAACVSIRGAPTALGSAARGACAAALEELAALGADPWLASSQEGSSDAFAWLLDALAPSASRPAARSRAARAESCLGPAAALLAGNAPGLPAREACARLAKPAARAVEAAQARGETQRAAFAQQLWARCEALAMSSVAASEPSAKGGAPPRGRL